MDTPEGSMFSLRSPMFVAPLLASILLLSCSRPSADNRASVLNQNADPWAKQAWIDKAARALRFGNGLGPTDQAELLAEKPREQIVDQLMQDPRFIETVFDFNLYFLNFKPAQMSSGRYLTMPAALAAAQAVAANGDYFSLFNYDQPFYLSEFRKPYDASIANTGNSISGTTPQISDRELRLNILNKALAVHDELIAIFRPTGNLKLNPQALCAQFSEKMETIDDGLNHSGLPVELQSEIKLQYRDTQFICFVTPEKFDPLAVYQTLLAGRDKYSLLMAIVDHPAATNYHIVNPVDVIAIDPKAYGVASDKSPFTSSFWFALPNSSTNYNRRRAAYMLKTYFCDDLTPVNIALATSHAGNKHADDPGCAACHYKLDPMAGFFRNRGVVGNDFEKMDFLIFDDFATVGGSKVTDYVDSWRAPTDAVDDPGTGVDTGRKWNIGYIRSPKMTQLNSYGESLRDLSKIIRDAKEVRQCLTRRMAEYFLGKGQVFDGAWINTLAAKFDDATASIDPAATSKAFKEIVKDLVLSKTFTTPDPQQNQCYDFAPGQQPTTLPCEVAFVIQKNCSSCHSGAGASGNLDLMKWQASLEGSYNFVHTDDRGQQLSKSETFKRLLERLSSSDESILMPLNTFMSATERAQLFKWVSKEAEAIHESH